MPGTNLLQKLKGTKKQLLKEGGAQWPPLTYNLLDHPELQRTKNNHAVANAHEMCLLSGWMCTGPAELNLDRSLAGTLMDKIVEHKVRERALNQMRHEHEEEQIQQKRELFNSCLRMTAGVAFQAGELSLSDGTVLQRVQEQQRQ